MHYIQLSQPERETLENEYKNHYKSHVRQRCQALLLSDEGWQVKQITLERFFEVIAGIHGGGARTSDNVEELEIATYDGTRMKVGPTSEEELERIIKEGGRKGEIYRRLRNLRDKYADLILERFPDIPRRVSGYNLDELLPENGFNIARALVGTYYHPGGRLRFSSFQTPKKGGDGNRF